MPIARALRGVEPGHALERFRQAFFASFFDLLLLGIALSEWVVVTRLLSRLDVGLPAWAHVVGPVLVWLANRTLARRRPSGGGLRARLVRGYVAFAFTSVFCGVFVGVAQLVRAIVTLGAIPANAALGTGFGLHAGDGDPVFSAIVDTGLLGIGLLFLWGYTGGRRGLATTSHVVPVPGLPESLRGLRIVHLTDLHLGDYLGPEELARHVAHVNRLEPDLICLTGDLVDRAHTCAVAFPVLAGLRARHGVFATLGNHDHGAGADEVAAALRALTPFEVMRDEARHLSIGGASLAILGLDDLGVDWARGVPEHPALPGLVEALPPGSTTIVLSHRPDCFPQAARLGASLVLSGHTHGGQLGLPSRRGRVRNLAEFITAFDRGVYRIGDAMLLVNRGLGFTGQPIRLFNTREIACLELRAA